MIPMESKLAVPSANKMTLSTFNYLEAVLHKFVKCTVIESMKQNYKPSLISLLSSNSLNTVSNKNESSCFFFFAGVSLVDNLIKVRNKKNLATL